MIEQDERRFDMRLAEIRGDYSYLRTLEDQEFLAERIAHWKERGKAATEAEKLAADDLAAIEAARADNLRRRVEDQERSRQLELARIRGDDPSDVRRLEQELRVRQRAAELEASFDMNESEAKAQAEREAAEENRAFMQGYYRDVVKGGFTAALQGDFKGWFERWWHDRIFNSMESLLNQLGDLLAGIGSKSSGGGGLLGTIGSVAGAIIGGKSSGKPIKKFASGGGFEIRGFPGIDQNLLSLNGNPVAAVSQGEIVNVQQGAAGREPAIVQLVIGEGQMFEPRVASISGGVTVQYGRQRDRYAGLRAGQRLA